MKLMTKEIEKRLEKSPRYSHEGEMMEAKVIVKYFNPYGRGTWLITEGEKTEEGDWLLFGYCKIFEAEWGYVLLSELQKVNPLYGLSIEREIGVTGNETVRDISKWM